MTKLRVGLLFGGCSGEHDVSIRSARAIANALQSEENRSKYELLPFYIQKNGVWQAGEVAQHVLESGQALLESETGTEAGVSVTGSSGLRIATQHQSLAEVAVWFPILHGPNGEDGTVQGLLKLMEVPFVGSGVLGSAVGMDKIAMKMAFAHVGLPQVNYVALNRSEIRSSPDALQRLCDRIEGLGYPCFVKPANLGSSVGIAKVRDRHELEAALNSAASYDRRIVVEAGVEAREVECAVLGNDQPETSVVGEITYSSDFYDYETKYTEGQAQLHIPAAIPDAVAAQIQAMSLQAFAVVDAAGLARVDFFYVEATGEVLINEINTFPGFTATSMYPRLWAAKGVSFPQLVDRLIQLALERH